MTELSMWFDISIPIILKNALVVHFHDSRYCHLPLRLADVKNFSNLFITLVYLPFIINFVLNSNPIVATYSHSSSKNINLASSASINVVQTLFLYMMSRFIAVSGALYYKCTQKMLNCFSYFQFFFLPFQCTTANKKPNKRRVLLLVLCFKYHI